MLEVHRSHSPLVSIIIPCYNYDKYIKRCIESALDQAYSNIEVIVIDNGSTDRSLSIIEQFSNEKKIEIMRFSENNPPGKRGSFHIGEAIQKSKGEYISILYADDWYLPDKISKQISFFLNTSSSVGVVYCHGYHYSERSDKLSKWKMQDVNGYVFRDYLLKGDVVIPISPLVKRYCYDIIGLNNIWTGTEYDMLILSQYVDFDFVDDYLVVMTDHDNNDAKNIHSVYKRLKKFHTTALLSDSSLSREGVNINKRISRDYMSFCLHFITMMDMSSGKEAAINAIKLYPLCILNPKSFIAMLLLVMPKTVSKYFLNMFNKLSTNSIRECDW